MTLSHLASSSTSDRSVDRTDWFSSVVSGDDDGRSFFDEMIRHPYRFDFFQAVRRVESLTPSLPRIGWATRADQEVLRIGQSVHLDFAPATIDEVSRTRAGHIRLQQRFFGLWGPSGALPLPMTESARDQWRHESDRTQIAFADIFHHRMATLFYRVWSTSRGAIQRDRPDHDRFAFYVASLAGIPVLRKPQARAAMPGTGPGLRKQATVESAAETGTASRAAEVVDDLRRFHAARFGVRRNADGLQDLLARAFGIPVEVRIFVPTTLQLRGEDHACLKRSGDRQRSQITLGGGIVLGRRIEDHTSTIELRLGPLELASYQSFMPDVAGHVALRRLVRGYAGRGLQFRVRLILQRRQTPAMCLGKSSTIGRDAWLHGNHDDRHADDYSFFL